MTASDLTKQVRDFLILKTGAKVSAPDEDCVLVGAGLVDSFGLVTLLAEVEARFGVFPDLMKHDPRDYSTLLGLTRIILQNLGVAAASCAPSSTSTPIVASSRIERLSAAHPLWSSLPVLFKEMFDHFATVGVQLPLVSGGEHLWLRSIEGLPDKALFVAGAIQDNELQGFITARMKLVPGFLGGGWVGEVSHLFVRPAARRRGFAAGLAAAAMQWFLERGAASVELQVLGGNTGAHAFWQHQGFDPELVQFRKRLPGARHGVGRMKDKG